MSLSPSMKTVHFSAWIATLLAGLFCFGTIRATAADEWPQFRGPDGQGHTESAGLPLKWSETENVKWKCADPGEGWSSPVISGNEIWMTTATGEGRSLRAVCVDFTSGKLLKDVEVFHCETPIFRHKMNSFASPSPILEAGRLYVSYGSCGIACLSTETGAVLWKRNDMVIDHQVGPGSTPALWKDKLILVFDGKDQQYVVALNKATGETVWKTNRTFVDGKRPDPSHSSGTPLCVTVNGVDQVLAPGPQRAFAYDAATGRELWWVTYKGWSICPRPLFAKGVFYLTTGWGTSALMAVRADGRGDVTQSSVVWKTGKQVPMMASPVLAGDRLYAVTDESGAAYCLDAAMGADVWRDKIGGKFSASLLAAPGRIYFFDRDGTTTVIEAGDTFKILAQNKLDSGFMASAAVSGNALILRTRTHLYRIEP